MANRIQPRSEEIVAGLECMSASIRNGTLSASPSTLLRIEGAIVAFRFIGGATFEEILAALTGFDDATEVSATGVGVRQGSPAVQIRQRP